MRLRWPLEGGLLARDGSPPVVLSTMEQGADSTERRRSRHDGCYHGGAMTRQVSCDRRTFVTRLATGAVALSSATQAAETPSLPTISLGKHKVTRLVAGYNPIGG